ncbi:restriction endonuclease subunit S [Psychrobacillus sp. FSL K6-4615]|uniref:restriction endonuclease subunit S n=1 Tax=Psychrobacillus sp. FSL K6-4615 TaxID=2921551 RepID=UPI0030F87E6E
MSKKTKVQTLDELLEEALVPEDEQPYEIPENWVWVYLKDITQINMGQSPKGENTTENIEDTPLIGGPADMGENFPIAQRFTSKPTKLSEVGELIVSIRATLGKTNIADGEYCLGRGVAGIRSHYFDLKLLRFYFSTIKNYLYEISTGTTFSQISKNDIEKLMIPLPPIKEQKRILYKLEELWNKIDEAKQLIKEANETFELRRVAILEKAFHGELTRKWRKENVSILPYVIDESIPEEWKPVINIPNTWVYKSVEDICIKVTDGTHDTPKRTESGVPYITARHIREGKIDFDNCDYVSEEDHKVIYSRCNPEKNDILLVNIGAGTATTALINVDFQFSLKNVALLKPDNSIVDSKYLEYYLRFVKLFIFNKFTNGGAQPFLSLKKIKSIPIIVPTLQEQKEIIDKLDLIFQKEIRIKAELERLSIILNDNKMSILSKAFKGELGTNDSNDEPAIELLKSALHEKLS